MQPNPHLLPLAVVIGEWTTQGAHPLLAGRTFHGRTIFDWLESGAFLRARMHIDEPEIPDAVALFGTDDDEPGAGTMLYFDVRGVSRHYRWTLAGTLWTWSRTAADLSQRRHLTLAPDTITSIGEMSRDGTTWEPDLELTYTRSAPAR